MPRPLAPSTLLSWQALLAGALLVVGALSCEGGCGGAEVCDPVCQSWEACVNGSCSARSCFASDECGGGSCVRTVRWDDPSSRQEPGTCGPRTCRNDSDCDDGIWCNGTESCGPVPGHEIHRCRADPPPCNDDQLCDESENRCYARCAVDEDADDDGARALTCGGYDCDDTDPERSPGRPEICDAADKDEDCDPTTFGDRDADRDGFVSVACCNTDASGNGTCGEDCDDFRAGVHPLAPEVCDGLDQDCDGAIDEGVLIRAHVDADRDGYGAAGSAQSSICDTQLGAGFSVYANDCNDANAALTPGTFVCEGGQDPQAVTLCTNTGAWTKVSCGGNTVCVTQPSGVGVCR